MSLIDEIPPKNNEICFSNINQKLHDEIDYQIMNFQLAGGKIQEIPYGQCALADGDVVIINEFKNDQLGERETRKAKGKKGSESYKISLANRKT